MSKLISGKEALIALANGEKVEYKNLNSPGAWHDARLLSVNTILCFDDSCIAFRLKPRTITINGIEVPSCGKNYQEGEQIYVLDDYCDKSGYIEFSSSGRNYEDSIPELWWRTEEEIKQVVEVLRKVFNSQ